MDSPNWLSDIEEYKAELLRGEREAVSSTGKSLLRSLRSRVREEERRIENEEWQNQVSEVI